jgi:hypothetical protein
MRRASAAVIEPRVAPGAEPVHNDDHERMGSVGLRSRGRA